MCAHALAGSGQDLVGRGWYAAHDFIPFAPWRVAPRGAVPRKDGGPARGIVDHGAPRTELATVPEGEEVKSVNAVSREVPRPHEDKPTLGDAAHNGAVLKHIADSSGQPVFSIAFDFKYYFHQLWYAASLLPLMGVIMPEPGAGGGASARTGCYSEHVMAMGMHASSGYAQRFANALLQAFCKRMDSEERTFESLESELVRAWLTARRTLQHDDYGTQAKLYDKLMFLSSQYCGRF